MAQILSADQLLDARQKAIKRQLPSFGPKDYDVTNSDIEENQISEIISVTKSLLSDERVEKCNLLLGAEWDKDRKLAKVTRKIGKTFEIFGHSKDGVDYLYPEEALFLLENTNLELSFDSLPISIQRGYSLLISCESGCNLNEYRVFSHLSKNGFRVFRHDETLSVSCYEKQINLDLHIFHKSAKKIAAQNLNVTSPCSSTVSIKKTSSMSKLSNDSGKNSSQIAGVKKSLAKDVEDSVKNKHRESEMRSGPQSMQVNDSSLNAPVCAVSNVKVAENDNASLIQAQNSKMINESSKINEKANLAENSVEASSLSRDCSVEGTALQKSGNFAAVGLQPIVCETESNKLDTSERVKNDELFSRFNFVTTQDFLHENFSENSDGGNEEDATNHESEPTEGTSPSKSKNLSHDKHFDEIGKCFPLYSNGMIYSCKPPKRLLPPRITTKKIEMTYNKKAKSLVSNYCREDQKFRPFNSLSMPRTKKCVSKNFINKNINWENCQPNNSFPVSGFISKRRQFRKGFKNRFKEMFPGPISKKKLKRMNREGKPQGAVQKKQTESNNCNMKGMNLPIKQELNEEPNSTSSSVKSALSQANQPIFNSCPDNVSSNSFPNSIAANQTDNFDRNPLSFTPMNQPSQNQGNKCDQQPLSNSSVPPGNQRNTNFQNFMNRNFSNPNDPNFSNQENISVKQENPNFSNQENSNFSNRGNNNFFNQGPFNTPNQENQNFSNFGKQNFFNKGSFNVPNFENSNFFNQGNPNFSNQGNPNFSNQGNPNFSNQRNPDFFNQGNSNFSNQGNYNCSNQGNPNFFNQRNRNCFNQGPPNPFNQGNSNFSNQGNPNFSNQGNSNFSNQGNPNFANQGNSNFSNQGNPNFSNQGNPNFFNQGNSNFSNQGNPNFSNQGNSNFFNQRNPNFSNQGSTNFMNRNPGQGNFQRYNHQNHPMSEVTRHARKMQGMARRMLQVAQAMFKNPEEFFENPENINIYNFSNRFRQNQNNFNRNSNQMNNCDNYRGNFGSRFQNNAPQNFNSNFNQNRNQFNDNSFGRNFPNFQGNMPDSTMNSMPSVCNNVKAEWADGNSSHDSNLQAHNSAPNNFSNVNARVKSEQTANPVDLDSSNSTRNASAVSHLSDANESTDDIFFIDNVGENPKKLLDEARKIPASQPTISFSRVCDMDIKTHESSSSSSSSSTEDSDSSEDEDIVEILEEPRKKSAVETVDILSSDEDLITDVRKKFSKSKKKAKQICAQFKNKKQDPSNESDIIEIDVPSRRNRKESTSDHSDIVILDDEDSYSTNNLVPSTFRVEEARESNSSNFRVKTKTEINLSNTVKNISVADKSSTNTTPPPHLENRIKIESPEIVNSQPIISLQQPPSNIVKQEKDAISQNCDTSEDSGTNFRIELNIKQEPMRNEQSLESDALRKVSDVERNQNLNYVSPPTLTPSENMSNLDQNTSEREKQVDPAIGSPENHNSFNSIVCENGPASIDDVNSGSDMAMEASVIIDISESSSNVNEESSKSKSLESVNQTLIVPESSMASDVCCSWEQFKTAKSVPVLVCDSRSSISEKIQDISTPSSKDLEAGNEAESCSSETVLEESLIEERQEPEVDHQHFVKSLLQPEHCKNLDSVLAALQIFKSPILEEENGVAPQKITFDVYQPKRIFAKASRAVPDFRIIVTGYLDPVPSPAQINEVVRRFSDNVKILFAVVHPSSISFFFINNIDLPVQISDFLF